MTGNWPRNVERAKTVEGVPQLFVVHEHYALLWRLASRPEPAHTRVELEVVNKFIPGPVTVYNTVGEIRGTEKPDEYVVCGAHLDSWDLGQGTTDNGTGSCTVLETARILGKAAQEGIRPKRTIRFILFTGEEEGLWGSRRYVEAHPADMPKTSAAFIHDTGTGRVVGVNAVGSEAIKETFDRELVSLKELGVSVNLGRGGGGGGGSDHATFQGVGVPGVMYQQDRAEYGFTHHSQSDTLDKAREPDLIESAQVMAICALRTANLPELLPRIPVNPGRRGGGGN
jgi:Zn-dependent M28 family amino/carboxypeptidase